MSESHEFTPRELARHLDANSAAIRDLSAANQAAIRDLSQAVRALESQIAQTYVRKDVWLEARKNDADAGLILSEQVKALIALRDWTVKIIVGAVLLALLGLVLVSNGGSPT